MDVRQNIEEFQKVSDYRLIRKTFKGAAIGSIIFGVIAIVMGFASAEENPVNVILAFIGIFLFAEGIWLLRTSNPKGMIVDGIALCILGIWNIVVGVAGAARWAVIIGIFQIYWGFQSIRRYGRFSGISPQKPSEPAVKQVDDIVKSVTKTKPAESEDIIELQIGKKPWKGQLTGDVGIFVTVSGDDVIFARRDEVSFISQGVVTPKKPQKISAHIGSRTFEATISVESMERYESWKGTTKARPEARPEVTKETIAGVAEVSSKSRLATTLLTFFLGTFGAHRFYLGKIKTAVIMLTLSILGWVTSAFEFGYIFLIPVYIWVIVDLIFTVSGKMKDKEGNPVKNW